MCEFVCLFVCLSVNFALIEMLTHLKKRVGYPGMADNSVMIISENSPPFPKSLDNHAFSFW